jgi:hypothetical protein
LKHLKPRSTEIQYGASNVILYRIKKSRAFLHFEFEDYGRERDHLVWQNEYADGERAKSIVLAKQLYTQGATQRRIAFILGVSHTTVSRYLQAATPGDENILKEDDIRRLQEENV